MIDATLFDQWLQRITTEMQPSGATNSASSYWKRYFHFDTRLTEDSIIKWRQRLLDSDYIRSHAFYPFLRHEVIKKTFGDIPVQNALGEIRHIRAKLRVKPTRPICYAAHQDALIYAWYAFNLHQLLEKKIDEAKVNEHVIAYRSADGRCNIHFAKEAFDFVSDKGECVALAFDVKSFFDTLDHGIVKQSWCRLLDRPRLPPDHYTVFKSMTKFRFVRLEKLKQELGEEEFEARRKSTGRFSYPPDFRKRIRPLIETNPTKGIPQGAPLSAVLSNMYMLEADKIFAGFAEHYGGYYRRYCDDILMIVPTVDEQQAHRIINETMTALNLCINGDKTEIRRFKQEKGKLTCYDENGKFRPLQYLGLEFDGREIRLRSASLSKFHHRLRRNVRQAGGMAFGKRSYANGKMVQGSEKILKRTLYTKYSLLGNRNFTSYARKAYEITHSAAIRKQYLHSIELVNECVAIETARRKHIIQKALLKQHEADTLI